MADTTLDSPSPSSESGPPAAALRTLTPSLFTSLFVIFTGAALVALVTTLYIYARQVVTTPFQRVALVVVTILLGLLGLAGVVVAVVDLVWRLNGHYKGASAPQAEPPSET